MTISRICVLAWTLSIFVGCKESESETTQTNTSMDASSSDAMSAPDNDAGDSNDGSVNVEVDSMVDAAPPVDMALSGPECPSEGDKCPAACEWLTECAITSDRCPGFNEDAREGLYEGCLESCAAVPAQAIIVCGQNTCEETLTFATGADEGFRELCEAEPPPPVSREFDGVYQLSEETWSNCEAWSECGNQEDIWYMVVDGGSLTWFDYRGDACNEGESCYQRGISGRITYTENGFTAEGQNGNWSVDFTRRGENGLASTFVNEGCEDSPWVYDFVSADAEIVDPICVIKPLLGEQLPELTAPDQNGNEFPLSSTRGGMTLVSFNAGDWCPPCVQFAAQSQALMEQFETQDDRYTVNFVQLMIDNGTFGEPADQASAALWAETHGISYPVLHGEAIGDFIGEHLSVLINTDQFGVPSCWLVDPLGQIREYGWCGLFEEGLTDTFEIFLTENPGWPNMMGGGEPDPDNGGDPGMSPEEP